MDSGRLFFDPSCHGNMLFIGNSDPLFPGGGRRVMNMEETSKRRAFFRSAEDMYEEEYYDEQSPEKKRRLTPDQVVMLEKSFEVENKLEPERKTQLAKKLGLQPRQVAVWFQNRRARSKTKQLEMDYDLLKSSYDSLFSNLDSIRKDNDKLKSEVISLTEKLQAKEDGEPSFGPKPDPIPEDVPENLALQFMKVNAEDRLSTGSGESAVVDEDGPQLVDSGNSFFEMDGDYSRYVVPGVDGVHSSEEDGSDDGRSYFSEVFVALPEPQDQEEEGEGLGWWVWS